MVGDGDVAVCWFWFVGEAAGAAANFAGRGAGFGLVFPD